MGAVHPQHQGKKVCSALLHFLNIASDQTGYPCYLNTSGERNLAVFGKYGWGKTHDTSVIDPTGTVEPDSFDTLVRQPTPGAKLVQPTPVKKKGLSSILCCGMDKVNISISKLSNQYTRQQRHPYTMIYTIYNDSTACCE